MLHSVNAGARLSIFKSTCSESTEGFVIVNRTKCKCHMTRKSEGNMDGGIARGRGAGGETQTAPLRPHLHTCHEMT